MKLAIQTIARMAALVAFTNAVFAQEAPCVELPTPDVSVMSEDEFLASLEGQLELLAFTHEKRGSCRACDMVTGPLRDLQREYPVTFVYVDRPSGKKLVREWSVRNTPSFVLVKRGRDGRAKTLARWSGAAGCRERVEREFRRAGFDKRGHLPPPARKRPVPKPDESRRGEPERRPFLGIFGGWN